MWQPAPIQYESRIYPFIGKCACPGECHYDRMVYFYGCGKIWNMLIKQTKNLRRSGGTGDGNRISVCSQCPVLISFTQDKSMIELVQKLMFIDIALKPGRVTNLVCEMHWKTSGDAVFPVILELHFMFLLLQQEEHLVGIQLHLAVVGAISGLTADECCRAVGMLLRWQAEHGRKRIDQDWWKLIRGTYKTGIPAGFCRMGILLLS